MAHNLIGYLTPTGEFIDCSNYGSAFAHLNWCDAKGEDEEELMENRCYVKLTSVFPNSYLYMARIPMTVEQQRFLRQHGIEIDDFDVTGEEWC